MVGIDPSAQYVSYAESRKTGSNVRFESGDARKLPFPPAQFDATTSLLVLQLHPGGTQSRGRTSPRNSSWRNNLGGGLGLR